MKTYIYLKTHDEIVAEYDNENPTLQCRLPHWGEDEWDYFDPRDNNLGWRAYQFRIENTEDSEEQP